MTLHCETIGAGPDLVLLHGWGLHAGIWAPLAELLASSYRLHLIDLPGHGRSDIVAPYTLAALADAVADSVPKSAAWLGWSLGGLVALEAARRHPERVPRLVLLACNPCFVAQADAWPGMRAEVLDGFARDLVTEHAATLQRFLALVARGAPDNQVLRRLRRDVAAVPPPCTDALTGGLTLLRDTDARAALGLLQSPVCLIGGVRDTLVPIAALRQLQQRYPQIALHEIDAAGHVPFLSHAHETCAIVQRFLT